MRRLLTFVIVALGTAAATSAWLYDGDLAKAVSPVLPEWNADALAAKQGIVPAEAPLPTPPIPQSADGR